MTLFPSTRVSRCKAVVTLKADCGGTRRRGVGRAAGRLGCLAGRPRAALALAMLAVSLTPASAAAQSGSEAVVCVGSEIRTLQTNPIRRIYTEDMEVVYRIAVDIDQRAEVERTLRSELGSYPDVWCVWSDPEDDHAVVVSYTGVIREDLTVDPEDPRFQAFSVGFGTGFDEAETRATTIDQRFSSQSDGSGYEVLLRENRGERALAADRAPAPSVPEGRICTEDYSTEPCWMELADRPGCYLWNPFPQENVTVTWSRGCSGGFAQGSGRVSWYQNDELIQTVDTRLQDGRSDGPTEGRADNLVREVLDLAAVRGNRRCYACRQVANAPVEGASQPTRRIFSQNRGSNHRRREC